MKGERPTVAEVDLAALAWNFAELDRLAGGKELIAVVKADGYGHGAVRVATRLVDAGCRRLAVATVSEAAELRKAGIAAPILVLCGVHDAAEASESLAIGATPVVHHSGHLPLLRQAASRVGRRAAVQLEVDTGMARMGAPPEDAPVLLETIAGAAELELEGVYTHLARADETDLRSAREQLALFGEVLAAVGRRGIDPGCVHVANSAALLASPELADATPAQVNAVRPGLSLYGVTPAPHLAGRARLRPVMSLCTRVANVRWLGEGSPVGYGGTWHAPRRCRIATLPIGYADGVPWSLGGRGVAMLRGQRVAFAGRVSMDLVTLDVGDTPVEIGDPVLLFGALEGGEPALLVEELAEAAGTIPYEILVRVGRRVPRVERT